MDNTDFTTLLGLSLELKLPQQWLKSQADAGQIPCLKIGRKYRFNVASVRAALAGMAGQSRIPNDEGQNNEQ